jgi:galactokinase/mevalonate kinase-like predicted kinase
MVNNAIKKAEHIAQEENALGFKCNGAGGGGSVVILADIGTEYQLKKKLMDEGFTILPSKLNFRGVETWTREI